MLNAIKHFTFPFIPPRVKQVGEFNEIRHKKISPTRIPSTLECLSLCDSVANKPPIISAACSVIGPKKNLGPKFFFRPRAGRASAGGQKTVICKAFSAISQLRPKIIKQN